MEAAPVTLQLHAAPAAGFDEPFAMLHACHERVQRMLALLQRLAEHLALQGADEQAAAAARDVLRYFDQAGPAHHEDEERHVLPRLRGAGEVALAERLHADHQQMTAQWQRLRARLLPLAERRELPLPPLGPDALRFAELYREHIEIEEGRAFPLAAAATPADAVAAMGEEMAARRGLTAPPGAA
jgi:hemerythrin-like domain-containing protein